MHKLKDITGQKFGRLSVVSICKERNKSNKVVWLCQCDCGNTTIAVGSGLRSGHTRSCGCLQSDVTIARNKTHGHSKNPTYYSYNGMKRRCYLKTEKCYRHYGGRGIVVCDRWLNSYENFLADMGEKPKGMSIDRIDNNGPYSPENCRWATRSQQQNNKRNNRIVTFNGETYTATCFAKKFTLNSSTILNRLYAGWPVEEAVLKPIRAKPLKP